MIVYFLKNLKNLKPRRFILLLKWFRCSCKGGVCDSFVSLSQQHNNRIRCRDCRDVRFEDRRDDLSC